MAQWTAKPGFLADAAGRHFVLLTYKATPSGQGGESKRAHISGFVVSVGQAWIFVTAGHVVRERRDLEAAGYTLSSWYFFDAASGHDYPGGIPVDFSIDRWLTEIWVEEEGLDYGAAPLEPLEVLQMEAGKVVPLSAGAWGEGIDLNSYDQIILIGSRTESIAEAGGIKTIAVTQIPLLLVPAPANTTTGPYKRFARIHDQPGKDEAEVTDVKGMSGGPIFGLVASPDKPGSFDYHAIGIQSGWIKDIRVVSFCLLLDFLREMQALVEGLSEPIEGGEPIDG